VSITPAPSGGDGVYTTGTVQGRTVWQAGSFLYFDIPASLHASAGQPVYGAVQYYDNAYQTLRYQYDGSAGAFAPADVTAHSSLVNSGTFQTAYFQLLTPTLQKQANGHDFRISSNGASFSIASVTLQTTPFPDATFQMALTKPWLTPIFGNANSSTLQGTINGGYQGWFKCPNDVEDGGWVHWDSNNAEPFTSQDFFSGEWPDVSYYPASAQVGAKCPADQIHTASGKQAYVFSSTNPDVVQQHFLWMQQYNYDGVWLQRFLVDRPGPPGSNPEWVLANVRRSASSTGRIWAIEYDISGLTDANLVSTTEADWKWLVSSAHILQDTNYEHNNGKPVVIVWGLSLRPGISVGPADTLINFLRNDPVYGGNYVIGGIGNNWPSLLPTWQEHYQRYNGLLVWQPQNNANDKATFNSWGVDWYPHVWVDHGQAGQVFWSNMYDPIKDGADRMFLGMFDEYFEGDAIIPTADDAPVNNPPFENNGGKSPLWWFQLAKEGKAMMLKQTPLTPTMPSQ
jgi:hypothetical protein